MSTLAELSISPLDKGKSVGEYVTRAVRVIAAGGLRYDDGREDQVGGEEAGDDRVSRFSNTE